MSRASVLFRIPERPEPFAMAAEERGAVFEDLPEGSGVAEWLGGASGEVTSVVFEDSDDPIDDIEAVLPSLRAAGVPYMAVTGSFEERSRGARALARVYVNLAGGEASERWENHPWHRGEPSFDRRSLVEAGYSPEEADEALAAFFPPSAGPRP